MAERLLFTPYTGTPRTVHTALSLPTGLGAYLRLVFLNHYSKQAITSLGSAILLIRVQSYQVNALKSSSGPFVGLLLSLQPTKTLLLHGNRLCETFMSV